MKRKAIATTAAALAASLCLGMVCALPASAVDSVTDATPDTSSSTEPEAGHNGWFERDGKKYWYDHGTMARSKQVYDPVSDAWYWFDADGTMARNKDVYIPDQYKWVRYDANGHMRKGEDYRYGNWYYFDPVTGAMTKGMVYLRDGNKWVYYDQVTGAMHHDLSYIDGAWYYFDHCTGKMAHKMTYVPEWNAYKYFDDVDGRWNQGQETAAWTEPSQESPYPNLRTTPNLNIQVSIANQQTYVRSGNTVIYTMISSTGLNDWTPRGDYTVNGRGRSFMNPDGMGANNWVRWRGPYLFHSVPINRFGQYIPSEADKLGRPASHGCVRLTIPDSQWLFDQLPDGTPVHIY